MSTIGYIDSSGNDFVNRFAAGSGGALTGYLDTSGNDLNTRFAPYVSGTTGTKTGYKDLSGNDLNGRFAPFPNFPAQQSSVPGIGYPVCVNCDGTTCVMSALNAGYPSGDPYHYLYWSNDYCATLNKATIGGSVIKFYGCVAISGPNAIAMGYTSLNATKTFYLSSDYGKTYTVTPTSGQTANGGCIAIDGSNAIFSGYGTGTYYSTNYGANWSSSSGVPSAIISVAIYGNYVYAGAYGNQGFCYSTNKGQNFSQTKTPGGVAIIATCVTKCGSNLYMIGQNTFYKSTDNGVTAVSLTSPSTEQPQCLTSCPGTSGDFIWCAMETTSNNYYSNNGGTSWTNVVNAVSRTCFATSNRIIVGGSTSLYWGKNAYII